MKIEMGKKYTTRDGRPVRIVATNGSDSYPIIGLIDGDISPNCWTVDGRWSTGCTERLVDLIEAKIDPVVEWGMLRQGVFYPTSPPTEQTARRVCQDLDEQLAKRTTEIVE